MEHIDRHISRGFKIHRPSSCRFYRQIPPFLGKTLLSILPAFFYCCSPSADPEPQIEPEPKTRVYFPNEISGISTLDIFVFNDDGAERLDCYQRIDDTGRWKGAVVSSGGKRIITALANSPFGKDRWFPMNSRAYFNEIHMNLEDETREKMVMFGELAVDTRKNNGIQPLPIYPIACEVRLNSICCDFTGKAYDGEPLYDVRVYLTNVNAECRITEEENAPPIRIINAGGPDMDEMEEFKDPSLIMETIPQAIGSKRIYPAISLWCYQSNHPTETPGTPYTRLVIEGKISGRTYYWPINVNREAEKEAGIWRGMSYTYDLKITRKGSTSPDIPVKTSDITINLKVAEWKEKEEYEVKF